MSVDREKLQHTLQDLHAQLDEADSLDADLAAQLREVAAEITDKLARKVTPSATQQDDTQASDETLEQVAVSFEQSHPTLAGTVRRLIDVLAQMGI